MEGEEKGRWLAGLRPLYNKNTMASIQQSLLSWKEIEASSDLDRLRMVLSVLPDETLMLELERARSKGRDDYPVRATWNSIIAGIVFQHKSIASLRRELSRNGELRMLCGFEPALGAKVVPSDNAYSNFLDNLMARKVRIEEMFEELVRMLSKALPDLCRRLALDSKAIASLANGKKRDQESEEASRSKQTEEGEDEKDRRAEHDADWGKKTYKGTRKDGTKWEKVVRWFGFKLHLIVDSVHELPVAYKVTKASRNDSPEMLPMLEAMKERHPDRIEVAEEIEGDKGYDSEDNNKKPYDLYGIKAIVDIRNCWPKDGDDTRLLDPERADNVVYNYKGEVFCICPATGERRSMAYQGFEADRRTLKYRCPAAAYGFTCAGCKQCPGGTNAYGRIVRIPLETDRRIFTPVARSSYAWETAYNRRTAVERVNSRLDNVLEFEQHHIRGLKKMQVRVGLSLCVMLAMALGWLKAGRPEMIRSLTGTLKPRRRKRRDLKKAA